jgi:hypothetical protein
MRLVLLLAALLVTPQAHAQREVVRFQTPSKNVGCLYWTAGRGLRPAPVLRCDILNAVKSPPTPLCQLGWTGFSMTVISPARVVCAGDDTVYARSARVVAYGTTWKHGGFTCTVRRVGLRAATRWPADSSCRAGARSRSERWPRPCAGTSVDRR